MTSAPWSARIMVAQGPESIEVKSTMRMPSSGPAASVMANLLQPFAARELRALADLGSRLPRTRPRSIHASRPRQRAVAAEQARGVAGAHRTPAAEPGDRPAARHQKPIGPLRARLHRQASAD